MAKVLANLARMTTATTGTGTITLGSAATSGGVTFLSFSGAGVADGDVVTYAIADTNASEIGRGTYTASGTTLTRTVLKSTNSNTAISLSGNAQVFITAASEDLPSIAVGKALTVNNTLTLAGTDSTTMTFPAGSSNVLTTGNGATITKGYYVTPNNIGTVSSGTTTPDAVNGNYQYYTNNGAHTLAAPSTDCAIDILVTNGASAGAITFSGFTVGSSTGSAYVTTNTNKFILSVRRINAVSTYSWYALQ